MDGVCNKFHNNKGLLPPAERARHSCFHIVTLIHNSFALVNMFHVISIICIIVNNANCKLPESKETCFMSMLNLYWSDGTSICLKTFIRTKSTELPNMCICWAICADILFSKGKIDAWCNGAKNHSRYHLGLDRIKVLYEELEGVMGRRTNAYTEQRKHGNQSTDQLISGQSTPPIKHNLKPASPWQSS